MNAIMIALLILGLCNISFTKDGISYTIGRCWFLLPALLIFIFHYC